MAQDANEGSTQSSRRRSPTTLHSPSCPNFVLTGTVASVGASVVEGGQAGARKTLQDGLLDGLGLTRLHQVASHPPLDGIEQPEPLVQRCLEADARQVATEPTKNTH